MNKRITRKLCIVGLISSIVLSGCGNAGITGGNREELSGGTDKVVSLKVWTEKDGLDFNCYIKLCFILILFLKAV